MYLTDKARHDIIALVAEAESRTGAQVMTAVVGKSDSYPEAPWKAFALGAALSALLAITYLPRDWYSAASAVRDAAVILGSGALLAFLAVLVPAFGRLFVDGLRAQAEAVQFAQGLFFSRGLGRTRGRLGVLILVSLFERRVVILADHGFDGRIGPQDWREIADRMTLMLGARRPAAALSSGVQRVQALLLEHGFVGTGAPSENLRDAPLELKGQR